MISGMDANIRTMNWVIRSVISILFVNRVKRKLLKHVNINLKKMKNSIKLVTLLLTAGFYSACTRQLPPDTRSRIPLEGNWGLQLDTAVRGLLLIG